MKNFLSFAVAAAMFFSAGTVNAWKSSASIRASSSESAAMAPEYAIDDDMGTRWASEFADNQWLKIELAEPKEIRDFTLHWEAAYAKNYAISVSDNGDEWDQVYNTSSGRGGSENINIDPVEAKFIRFDFIERGTEWGNSLYEIDINRASMKGAIPGIRATASSGTGDYSPDRAVDGDFNTRWSSDFSDDHWFQAEFEEPRKICGVVLHWETAFGEKYIIEVMDDGGTWHTVNETMHGDGERDILYFKPINAKKVKLTGIERGTGWGYSLWQIEFLDGNYPPEITASTWLEDNHPSLGMDGSLETYWHSGPENQAQFNVKLPKVWDVGALHIKWDEDYAVSYSIEVSPDGQRWEKVHQTERGRGQHDFVFFDNPHRLRHIRVNCLESSREGYSIAHLEIKGPEAEATPLRVIQAAAQDVSQGLYPMWLTRQQCYWTAMGVDSDEDESLISEWGSIEAYQGGFTVMPLILEGENLVTWNDCEVTQSLADNYLPIPEVKWESENFNLTITAFSSGDIKKSNTFARYQIENTSSENFQGKLILGVYPVQLNPVWQRGGFSAINNLEFSPRRRGVMNVKVNGQDRIISAKTPHSFGAVDSDDGDVVDYILEGRVPPGTSATDDLGLVTAAMMYEVNLSPGEKEDIIVCYPVWENSNIPSAYLRNPERFFESEIKSVKEGWRSRLNNFVIDIPEKEMIDAMRSNIAYILINKEGPWIKPGPRNYSHSWVRDGAMTCVALLRMGITEPVLWWIEEVTPHIHDTGMVPYIFFDGGHPVGFDYEDTSGEGKEFDSQGQYVYAVRQYIDYTGDDSVLERYYEPAFRSMRFQRELREQRLTDEYRNNYDLQPYYGILPQSNSHEGYFPAQHSHWDNFWGLRGLKDAIHLANIKGRTDDIRWLEEELESFREAVVNSINETIRRTGINHIPGCVELADNDVTSTSIAIMVAGELEHLPQRQLRIQYDNYFNHFKGDPIEPRQFTPYEVRNAEAYIRMGERERALVMLRYFLEDSFRPRGFNHMAEVVLPRYRAPSYIGDMPHTWVGSGYINTIRAIFVYEQDDEMYIGAGLDPDWFEEGVTVRGLPTIYGDLDFSVKRNGNEVIYKIEEGPQAPGGYLVPVPERYLQMDIYLNGRKTEPVNGTIRFDTLPAEILVRT